MNNGKDGKKEITSVEELRKALAPDMTASVLQAYNGESPAKPMTWGRYLKSWVSPTAWGQWASGTGPYASSNKPR